MILSPRRLVLPPRQLLRHLHLRSGSRVVLLLQRAAKGITNLRRGGRERGSLPEFSNGDVKFSRTLIGLPQLETRFGVLGIQPHRGFQLSYCLARAVLQSQEATESVPGLRVVRLQLQCLAKLCLRLRRPLGAVEDQSEGVMRLRVVRFKLDRAPEGDFRPRIVLQFHQRGSGVVMRLDEIRIRSKCAAKML